MTENNTEKVIDVEIQNTIDFMKECGATEQEIKLAENNKEKVKLATLCEKAIKAALIKSNFTPLEAIGFLEKIKSDLIINNYMKAARGVDKTYNTI